jgi:hypothetical protein
MANSAARIRKGRCVVSHRLELGYVEDLPAEVPGSVSLFRLTYTIRNLKKVRLYDVMISRKPEN